MHRFAVNVHWHCITIAPPKHRNYGPRLAAKHDGKDRWYLEALGIGADRQWDKFFPAYVTKMNDSLQSAAAKDIVWRARTDKAVPYIAKLAADQTIDLKDRLRYFRAFDFNTGPAKSGLLLKMIGDNKNNDVALNKLVLHHLDIKTVTQSPLAQKNPYPGIAIGRGNR